MDDESRLRQFETAADTADSYDHRLITRRALGGKRQASLDLVLVEDLDDSFGHAETRHYEQRRLSVFNGARHFSCEIGNAAVVTQRGLCLPLHFERILNHWKQEKRLACAACPAELDFRRLSFE